MIKVLHIIKSCWIYVFFFIFKILFDPCNQTYSESLGDLTRQNPIDITIEMHGKIGENHYFAPNELTFSTGKLYKLTIKNLSDSKHYFKSYKFAESIFTRKVQIVKFNNKIAEVKGIIDEIEINPGNEVEWWFVPIKVGLFKDLHCYIKDPKSKKKHSEMGMVGTIIIK